MDLLVAVPVRLLPAFPLFDFRGVLELLFGAVYAASAELLIVVQHRPGNRIMVRADDEAAPRNSGLRRRRNRWLYRSQGARPSRRAYRARHRPQFLPPGRLRSGRVWFRAPSWVRAALWSP